MQMHAEQHKRMNGDYGSQDRLDFSDFLKTDKKHVTGTCNCVTESKKNQKKHNTEKLNTVLKFTIICCFLDLLPALPQMH